MKPNNNPEDKLNTKDQSSNKRNYCNRQLKSKKEDVSFCYNYKNNNNKCKTPDNNTTKRYKTVNVKVNNNSKTLREQQDFIDSLFLNIIRFYLFIILLFIDTYIVNSFLS